MKAFIRTDTEDEFEAIIEADFDAAVLVEQSRNPRTGHWKLAKVRPPVLGALTVKDAISLSAAIGAAAMLAKARNKEAVDESQRSN